MTGWPVDLGTNAPTFVSCGQVTRRVTAEVVAASGNGIWLLRPNGTVAPGFPFLAPAAVGDAVGRVALGDITGNGRIELAAVFELGVLILDDTGTILQVLSQGSYRPSTSVSLADLDDDGDLEIAIPREDGEVELLHHQGISFGPEWPFQTAEREAIGAIAIADVFGDDTPELTFAAASGRLFTLDVFAEVPSGWDEFVDVATGAPLEPIVGLFKPGSISVALGDPDGELTMWDRHGVVAETWPRNMGESIDVALASGDLDGDGSIELVVPAGSVFHILDLGMQLPAPSKRWAMAGARATRSGCAETQSIQVTAIESISAPSVVRLAQNMPNPFNPRTVISFELNTTSDVRLAVYDLAGRRVRTLIDGLLPTGEHQVVWDGTDDGGAAIASGVYAYRVEADGVSSQRTMTLVR